LVNEKIRENLPVVTKQMNKDDAINSGAMALFGEKYADKVRVVIMDPSYSIELCGGTHVAYTGELGFFKIISESATGAGVRRIEEVCGVAAEVLINEQFQLMNDIREKLKNPKDTRRAIENLVMENGELKKNLEKLELKNINSIKNELLQKVQVIDGINYIGELVEISNPDALKNISFALKNDLKNYIVVVAAIIKQLPHVVIMIDPAIPSTKDLDASRMIKDHIAPLINGNGGGQKVLATAAGKDASRLPEIFEKIKQLL
jgi:alanyl-tRNA synthetase